MNFIWRSMLGWMKLARTLSAMPRAMGLTKNGIGAVRMRLKTSAIVSGGIAEPSAKCSQ